jgi:hypothetical protein
MLRILPLLILLGAGPIHAQALRSAPSTRATVVATLNPPRDAGAPAGTPVTIVIDYGQPHARGRAIAGALPAELDTIWRMGANEATALTTGVDLVIGNLTVPKGEYTLYARTSRVGDWQLIVSRKTKQWGTDYDPTMDLGRIPLRSRTLPTPLESLSFWLIPAPEGAPRGELRFAWGTREFSADWRIR